MDLGTILDADLDAERDFAPQCIIQKTNHRFLRFDIFGLLYSAFFCSNAMFLLLFCVCAYFGNNQIDAERDSIPKSGRISS